MSKLGMSNRIERVAGLTNEQAAGALSRFDRVREHPAVEHTPARPGLTWWGSWQVSWQSSELLRERWRSARFPSRRSRGMAMVKVETAGKCGAYDGIARLRSCVPREVTGASS